MKDNLTEKEIDIHGTISYRLNGKFHREDGPARKFISGTEFWLVNGNFHRMDGPAASYANGYQEWWIRGERLDCRTQSEFERLIKLKAIW